MAASTPRQAYIGCSFDDCCGGWSYLVVNQDGTFSGRRDHMPSVELSEIVRLTGLYYLLLETTGDLVINEVKPFYDYYLNVKYPEWLRNGFRNCKGKVVAYADLIKNIKSLMADRSIIFVQIDLQDHKFYLGEAELHAGAGRGKSVRTFEGRK